MAISPPASPPGWYPDPSGRGEFRWWTGSQWTYRIASGGQLFAEASGDLSAYPPPQSASPISSDGQIPPRGLLAAAVSPAGATRMSRPIDVVEVSFSPGAAFRLGFCAFWGWLAASLIVAVFGFLLVIPFAVYTAASVRPPTP